MPDDIAREKQSSLARQLEHVESVLATLSSTGSATEGLIEAAVKLTQRIGDAYQQATDAMSRDYNQAWFTALCLDVTEEASGSPTRSELSWRRHS